MEKIVELNKDDEVFDDEIYETIEAPKFVDFTLPDRPLPDDRSWFCVRIGCDQNHEVIDPDALHKSFVLRVMAARSPYLRLRKTLTKEAISPSKRCPLSAPAKPSKPRMARMTEIASGSRKMVFSKGEAHPTSKLYSTPNKKAKEYPISAKALTTPRHKKIIPNSNPFRSVQNPKTSTVVRKNKMTSKALVFDSPTKIEKKVTPSGFQTPVTELCVGMKKLDIYSQSKKPSWNSSKLSRGAWSSTSKSATACRTSKSKLYTSKSKSRLKISQERKAKEIKSIRYVESKYTKSLKKTHGSQPQGVTENDARDMEIDRKSRTSSPAVGSVIRSVANKERNGVEECPVIVQENLGARVDDQQECVLSSRASSIPESGQTFSTDENSLEEEEHSENRTSEVHVEDSKESEHQGNIDFIQKGDKGSDEEEEVMVKKTGVEREAEDGDKENKAALDDIRNVELSQKVESGSEEHEETVSVKAAHRTGVEREAEDGDKENKAALDDIRNVELSQKVESGSEEHEETVSVKAAHRTGIEDEAKDSNDKENNASSGNNRNLIRSGISHGKTGQHETRVKNRKMTDGQCKTTIGLSRVAATDSVGGKQKKTVLTKPKPFRLRTDERGVLREANVERIHLRAPWKHTTTLAPTDGNFQKKHGSEQYAKPPTHHMVSRNVLVQKTTDVRMVKIDVVTEKVARKLEYLRTTKLQLLRQQLTRPQSETGTREKPISLVSPTRLSTVKESSSTLSRSKLASRPKVTPGKNVTAMATNLSVGACTGRSLSRGRREDKNMETVPKNISADAATGKSSSRGRREDKSMATVGTYPSADFSTGRSSSRGRREDKSMATVATNPSSAGRSSSRAKRAATVPTEPIFHKTHSPKSCTKTLVEAIS